ncbi:MAG TPA: DNA mismatch repair protein MutS [Betaproteobacteria bacterium]|nr:DNA mismatch repair protein MutS [Betaproteobacteria bacterium]
MAKIRGDDDAPADDAALFRAAIRGVKPLSRGSRVPPHASRTPPIPRQSLRDERQALIDSLSDFIPWDEAEETGEELSYLRPGMGRPTLRKLRRGFWVIQAELDLHGMTRIEARQQLAAFLNVCKKQGLRCVRIIHGKGLGSKNREPVLKSKVQHWLMQRDEVLAFCQARAVDGGGGAALVLLKSAAKS